jgi:hypothetical protein
VVEVLKAQLELQVILAQLVVKVLQEVQALLAL